jgi:hypothetical protein
MALFDRLAESRIEEAVARGDLDDLPGAGRPLDLDDAPFVPEELRAMLRVMKNAGLVPPEILDRRDAYEIAETLARCGDDAGRSTALRKLRALELRIAAARPGATLDPAYRSRVLARLR